MGPVGDGTTGTGLATWTSGFEGPWTSTPTQWSNEFFVYLVDKEWELWTGPGGHYQWRLKDQPDDPRMRLTSDMALLADPEFRHWVEVFARNATALDEAFDAAWHNLVNAGGGWSSSKRCVQLGSPPESPAAPSHMLDTDTDPAADGKTVLSGSQSSGVAGLAALASLVAQVPSFASQKLRDFPPLSVPASSQAGRGGSAMTAARSPGRLRHFFVPRRAAYIAPCLSRRGSVLAQSRTRGQAASRRTYSACMHSPCRPASPFPWPPEPVPNERHEAAASLISRAVCHRHSFTARALLHSSAWGEP